MTKKAPMRKLTRLGLAISAALGVLSSLPGAVCADSKFTEFSAPAGELPAAKETTLNGRKVAVLPNGRLLSPAGTEVLLDAPKPYGLALSKDGSTLVTVNSGASRFSVSLIRNLKSTAPEAKRVDVDASFLGVAFSPDGSRFYVSGGENGNIWVGDAAAGQIIGSVSLNGPAHPLNAGNPLNPAKTPASRFKGTFPGNLVVSNDGKFLYVVDQGAFQVHVIEIGKIVTGLNANGEIIEPNNFAAVVNRTPVGRYPYGISITPDDKTLLVSHVGVFQYTHLRPENPTGDANADYPLCYPGVGYPDETKDDKLIKIKKVDPRNLPLTQRDPEGIRCGYVAGDQDFKVPGLGDPNVPESSSVFALDLSNPAQPKVVAKTKTGLRVGDREDDIKAFSGSHPNSVAIGSKAIYVANGNNDSVSVLDRRTFRELNRIPLAFLDGQDHRLKGLQPVALALSPDQRTLFVAEAGINAVAMVSVEKSAGEVLGHIPTGWWPSSLAVSQDGKTLYVANAQGRGAGPNIVNSAPKHSVYGTVNIVPVPERRELRGYTEQVIANNGFDAKELAETNNPIPSKPGKPSRQIKHVIFINKENLTHDLVLGDITQTRKGVPVNGEPSYSLGYAASPNHHELALGFAVGDNFYLEPAVSSDGHRWLTNTYTTEFEQTHWPASYGGRRRDAGDDPEVIKNYPGRLGFTDADGSPDPHDYNQHGSIYLHLDRNHKSFVNFGNGYEFAIVDEDPGTDPTGIRQHVNVPMEKVVRDNSDHLFPEYNTGIPDAPLPEDPTRFNRFGRFKQVFEQEYSNKDTGECKLPQYVDLYYPNDHGGGTNNIYPDGSHPWSYTRFVQDNDAALGLTVDLISHSPCWKDTVIFVVEDDTQNGLDHVDGYRSLFLAIGPWVKHEYVSKTHASLASIFKTVNLILGMPPLNQYDAAATDLRDLFTSQPDFTPYNFATVNYAKAANPIWTAMTKDIDFQRPDAEEINLREAILKSEGLPRKPK